MINISINDLPDIPDVTGTFQLVGRDRMLILRQLIAKINNTKLTLGDDKYQCRVNMETMKAEINMDGMWHDLDSILDHWLIGVKYR